MLFTVNYNVNKTVFIMAYRNPVMLYYNFPILIFLDKFLMTLFIFYDNDKISFLPDAFFFLSVQIFRCK